MEFIKHYVVAAGIFLAIDAVWLSVVANKFYKRELKALLLEKPKFGPAALFYALYIIGLLVFVLNPALGQGSWSYLLGHAALFGLTMYATYDLTNQSTLKGWPAKITAVDLVWGTVVTTAVSSLSYVIFH